MKAMSYIPVPVVKRPLIDIPAGTKVDLIDFYDRIDVSPDHTEGSWLIFRKQIWRVNKHYTFRVNQYEVTIHPGFLVDGASIPKPLHWLYDAWDSQYNNGSFPHDGIYAAEIFPKWFNDFILIAGMPDASGFTKAVFWQSVDKFGWATYRTHTAKSVMEARRYVTVKVII
ncbi:MAG: DUF1353 domain-containing protein [Victivallales bacterium]